MQAKAELLPDHFYQNDGREEEWGAPVEPSVERLYQALEQLEDAVARCPVKSVGGAVVDELTGENQQLKEQLEAKGTAMAALEQQLREVETRNATVSAQVDALSARLEELTQRLGKLLEA